MGIRIAAIALSLVAAVGLVSCAAGPADTSAVDADRSSQAQAQAQAQRPLEQILADLGLDESDPKAMIEALEALPVDDRPSDLIASVLPTALQLQPGQPDETTLAIDGDEFYLSIAPFVSTTHPCTFHSLTTCLGELQRTEVDLTVTDVRTGEVVVSERTSTADNGFVGVWLPKNREFTVRIDSARGSAEQLVTTGGEDPTCLTTLQLV